MSKDRLGLGEFLVGIVAIVFAFLLFLFYCFLALTPLVILGFMFVGDFSIWLRIPVGLVLLAVTSIYWLRAWEAVVDYCVSMWREVGAEIFTRRGR